MDGFWGRIDLSKDKVVSRDDNELDSFYGSTVVLKRDEEKDGSPHIAWTWGLLYVPNVQCSAGSIFRRFYVPKVLYSENPLPTVFSIYLPNTHGPGIV